MSTQSEISRIEQAKTDIASAITAKGVTVPSDTKIDGMSSLIASISQSEDLSAELTEYARLNAELEATIDSLPEAGSGGGGGSLETCSVTLEYTGNAYGYGSSGNVGSIYSNQVVNGAVDAVKEDITLDETNLSNLVLGSFLIIRSLERLDVYGFTMSTQGITLIDEAVTGTGTLYAFKVSSSSGVITIS